MKRVLSAIQPTGDLHLGNYFGAVKNWVDLQDKYSCVYGVVDYHTMTMPYKAADLRENTWKMVFQLLACGVKAENLFIQSLVPEHTELNWILGCVTSYGEVSKMTQFKDKRDQLEEKDNQAFISAGLFSYPILQAADILIYKADYVPVGKDQEQHLELSRNIAARFNKQFGQEYFAHPEPLFTEIPKLLSPADPTKKMSKSLGEKHYINLFGDPNRIRKQIKSAVTDTGVPPAPKGGAETTPPWGAEGMSPGVENLFNLLKACNKMEAYDILMGTYHAGTLRYGDLKGEVAEALVALTQPFGERLADLTGRKKEVKAQIQDSSAEIRKIARQTLSEVKELVGLLNPKI
jgi:tryptophanyl-tRNA synthetase